MTDPSDLKHILLSQWQSVRARTYDYLHGLQPEHLSLALPFPESRSIAYQFWCMCGAQESYQKALKAGAWQGFSSSLSAFKALTPAVIEQQLRLADQELVEILENVGLRALKADGEPRYKIVFTLIEHEMHHQGQLINLMFCHHLPIPASWRDQWALSYQD